MRRMKNVIGKFLSVTLLMARGTATMMGFAVMLALTVGMTSAALAAVPGDPFKLGIANTVNAASRLAGSVAGPMLTVDNNSTASGATALNLLVESGKAPMKVNSDRKVANLNSDSLDGRSAGEIGVNGLQVTRSDSAVNSASGKSVSASCPAGKVLVGTGYDITGGKETINASTETNVVIDDVTPDATSVLVEAFEEEPTDLNWSLTANAICATAP